MFDRFKKVFLNNIKDKNKLRIAATFIIIFLLIVSFVYFYSWRLSNRSIDDEAAAIDESTETAGEESNTIDSDKDNQAYEYGAESANSGFAMLLKVIISLVIIVILIYATIRTIKFFYKSKGVLPDKGSSAKGFIKIIESKNITQNKAVHLVDIAGKHIILGSSESQLNYISEINSGQYKEFKKTVENDQSGDGEKKNFKDVFSNYFNKKS